MLLVVKIVLWLLEEKIYHINTTPNMCMNSGVSVVFNCVNSLLRLPLLNSFLFCFVFLVKNSIGTLYYNIIYSEHGKSYSSVGQPDKITKYELEKVIQIYELRMRRRCPPYTHCESWIKGCLLQR